jgi:hypothetical protein
LKITRLALGVFLMAHVAPAGAMAQTRSVSAEPELAVLYDFQGVEGTQIPDGSGHGHTGTLEAGEIVFGRTKPAVQFAGRGLVRSVALPAGLAVSRPLTVGAMCRPSAPDGVIAAMGGTSDGFTLYLQGGVPHFAVRVSGTLRVVVAPEAVELDQWVHLAGVVDAKGKLALLVNTWPVAESQGSLLARAPAEAFTIGADVGSFVGEYETPLYWQGLLQDVRLYWGALARETDRDLLAEWAIRPGCGCRK